MSSGKKNVTSPRTNTPKFAVEREEINIGHLYDLMLDMRGILEEHSQRLTILEGRQNLDIETEKDLTKEMRNFMTIRKMLVTIMKKTKTNLLSNILLLLLLLSKVNLRKNLSLANRKEESPNLLKELKRMIL